MNMMKTESLISRCYVKETLSRMFAHDRLRKHAINLGFIQVLADILASPETPSGRFHSPFNWRLRRLGPQLSVPRNSRLLALRPMHAAKGTYLDVSRGHRLVYGGSFGDISGGRFDVRDGSFGNVSGGTFTISSGTFGDISAGTFIIFDGNFGNVTGGSFIIYGGKFRDVSGGDFIISGGTFGDVRGGQFLVAPGSGKFGRVTGEAEFSPPEDITLNDMSGSLRFMPSPTNFDLQCAIYTHFNGVKELIERLADCKESREQLIRAGIISTLVGLISFVGVAPFLNILKCDDIRAAVLDAHAVPVIVTSMLDKGLVDSDDCNKSKIEVLSKLADHDVTSRTLVKRTIAQHLPRIRKSASEEIIDGLERLCTNIEFGRAL
ncbi:hypothetical protein BD779DRAFT_1208143 [Infundibulicybe gibba]|nr:hypothetical protein BD779DRAFT_1208143 [Infundibulicybe gibba]